MIGVYFSGTGNTKFCVDRFLQAYASSNNSFSIEEHETLEKIKHEDALVLGYPVQFSNIPKILRDYIVEHQQIWKGKKIFIIATMGLFSGDGAGILARLLAHYGAIIVGGLHLIMPNSISDGRALGRSLEKNKALVMKANRKIARAASHVKNGRPPQEGLGIAAHFAGLFGQRLYFSWKTKNYTDQLKINASNCIGCGLCEKLCPMGNITVANGIAVSGDRCTMCYRCISQCPKQAITLLGKRVFQQNEISKFL